MTDLEKKIAEFSLTDLTMLVKSHFNVGYNKAAEIRDRVIAPLMQAHAQEAWLQADKDFHSHYSGKPEKHPAPCNDCGSDYWVDWILPHPVFNAVCPGGSGYLCLPCFVKRMESQDEHRQTS